MRPAALPILLLPLFFLAACAEAQDTPESILPGFSTDTSVRSIELGELLAGGPPKDGIPSIDAPEFVSQAEAADWIEPQEPVVVLGMGGEARAYPLQILTWHEIVNDEIDGVPVAVTFCPLCYSAVAFDRRLDGQTLELGVSGFLRNSDMVMYDRQTETLWQQLTGEGIVGALTGERLRVLPAQIISFAQFRTAYTDAPVLSRETGHIRDYGRNPYAGYDDIKRRPFLYDGPEDPRLRPMEKVVALKLEGKEKAYPYAVTREARAINDTIGGLPLVVFHTPGAVSALDADRIAESKAAGSTGMFDRNIPVPQGQQALTFTYDGEAFVDDQTGTQWDVTGRAVAGPLEGMQLRRLPHGDYFAFAWFAFKPGTEIYAP